MMLEANKNDADKVGPAQVPALCKLYNTLHEYVADFGLSEAEVKDIQESVEEIVWQFADVVATLEPIFKAKSIHGVGSFYEKTKILKLDEFDFLYVIDELSNDNLVRLEKVFLESIFGVSIKVKDVQYFQDTKWFIDTTDNGDSYLGMLNFLPTKAAFFVKNPQESFSDVLSKAAETVRSQSLHCKKATGTLTLLGQENKAGPNVELWFEWKPVQGESFAIKSDITPVIRASNIQDMVTEEQCDHPPYLTRLHTTGSYLVMPSKLRHMQSPYTFSPTFTETERDLMIDLTQPHRIAYQCLKFLLLDLYTRRNPLYWDLKQFSLPGLYLEVDFPKMLKKLDYLTTKSFLSSYCLKTAVLLHCRNCQRQERPDLCGLDVINILLECSKSENPTLPSTFIKQDDLFWKLAQPDNVKDFRLMVKVLELLQSFHEKILKGNYDLSGILSPANNFRNMFALLIQMSEENGLQSEDSLLQFNPLTLSQGTVYNAYRFAKETEDILENTEMDCAKKKLLLDGAKVFYNFDVSSSNRHSTLASSDMAENLEKLKRTLAVYDTSHLSDNTETEVLQPEEKSDDETGTVTVIYSRI